MPPSRVARSQSNVQGRWLGRTKKKEPNVHRVAADGHRLQGGLRTRPPTGTLTEPTALTLLETRRPAEGSGTVPAMRARYFVTSLTVFITLAAALLLTACPPKSPAVAVQPAPAPPPPPPPPPPTFPASARNGELPLANGFAPQPFVVVGNTTGTASATTFNAPCPLYIAGPPEYILNASAGFQQLSVLGHSRDAGIGLMIMSESGGFLCSDPGDTSVRGQFPPGKYAIWVGTLGEGAQAFYQLAFSEQPDASSAQLESSIMGAWEATGDAVALAPGFAPDPQVVQGTVVGTIAASGLDPSCAGFVSEQPNHIVDLSGDFPLLKVLVRHTRDTALVVTDGRGNVWCGDDEDQRFPVVSGEFAAGRYRVFVATKTEGGSSGYSLGFTVGESTSARSLPRAPNP